MWIERKKYIDSDGQSLRLEIEEYNFNNSIYRLDKRYYNSKGELHRLDGPAIEYSNGSYSWFKNGKWHRIGGPAHYSVLHNKYNWFVNYKELDIYYICG